MENAFQREELSAEDTTGTTISNPKFPLKVTQISISAFWLII
jgi:hypothetical protein